jgi:asparagine N-glycosylation enzyme membrane subunit Stt3
MITGILYASAGVRLVVGLLVAFKLVWRYHRLGCLERLGLALMGGSAILTIPPIMMFRATPYDEWSGLLFGIGIALYILGKLIREWNYDR